MDDLKHSDTTGKVIRAFYNVYNALGWGFLEKVYENALIVELSEMGFSVERQKAINVYYKDKVVGEYFADLIVEGRVIVELKAAVSISPAHEAQLVNYLKATQFEVGLLLNFGQKAEYKRKISENKKAGLLSVLFDP
ncbi:MAG TPA: GxxExxY protein [Pyrinomonadaceae bacterium]|jgi:GxxExxY protein|nr:GxxExxY protein [Pyrinomonadaceae bacterium]